MSSTASHALRYPFETAPDRGEFREAAPGVFWLRMPLPGRLDHINLWLLRDDDSWTLIDTGMFTEDSRAVWQRIFETRLDGLPIGRVIVTHMHPDHLGCAGWLVRHWNVALWMSRADYLMGRVLTADTGREPPAEAIRFYRSTGLDNDAMHAFERRFGRFGSVVSTMPDSFTRLQHEDRLTIGTHVWTVVVGRGHAPEHACLHCEELNLFISGDQILPTISSNVSVWPTEPAANPLAEWLESCRYLKDYLPEDVLVLPAHTLPFVGARQRLGALIEEHEQGLERIIEACTEPQRAVDMFPILFRSQVHEGNAVLAAGESVAHLNYLVEKGRLLREMDNDGVYLYRAGTG